MQSTIVKEDLFAPFEARPDIAAHFIDHILRTNKENVTMTANLNAVLPPPPLHTHARAQILERAATENLGTLLRNLIIQKHLELSRGVFVYLRGRGLLDASMRPPPSARELSAKRKREAHARSIKASEFNDQGEFIDAQDRRLVIRVKRGRRYFYEHTPIGLPYHFIVAGAYQKPASAPDAWCGDYFLDSYETPILFRSRSFSDPSVIEYHRVVACDKLVAIAERDDAEYFRLVEEDEQRVHDDAEESETEAEAERAMAADAGDDRAAINQGRAVDLRMRRIYADNPVVKPSGGSSSSSTI